MINVDSESFLTVVTVAALAAGMAGLAANRLPLIDFDRIRGAPLRLGALGWLLSLALAYALGGVLALAGRGLARLHRLGEPLVVPITTIAVEEGHMRSSTAASLVGAAILSTTIFPLVALRLRARQATGAPMSP